MKLIMTKGLPASGKSTWARKMSNYKRINKDDLRAMLDDGKWTKDNEKFVIKARNNLIENALQEGLSVIVDDTNLAPKHEEALKQIAKEYGATFEIKDFTDVPIEECIKRDLKRPISVGEKVIKQMYNQFLKKQETYIPLKGKPTAILCDIDGTLAHMKDRNPFDWHRVGEDEIDEEILEILLRFSSNIKIIFLSGRDSVCRKETEEWLEKTGVSYEKLLMRPLRDSRKDCIVKKELFEQIKDDYNIMFVLDDRDQVVEMWRSLGLKCFQVAEGNF